MAAIDPICGMTVDEATARSADRDSKTYYFCSEHCRQAFVNGTAPASGHSCCHGPTPNTVTLQVKPKSNAAYFCPMCPGVESDKPGDCPKCGMALDRNPAWRPSSATVYTCPMHPEVVSDRPGDCPKCGMPLEPVVQTADDAEETTEESDLRHRLWISVILTLPVFVLAMAHLLPGLPHHHWVNGQASRWI